MHPDELKQSEFCLIRHSQKLYYPQEFSLLSRGLPLPNKSKLLKLNPVYDKLNASLRVGGRLKYANLSYDEKYPIILNLVLLD